jgi:hypothetical protein
MFCQVGISFFTLTVFLFFTSCKKQNECDCFKSRGSEQTDVRIITKPFNTIESFDKIDVYYIQDTTATQLTVSVETGSNLMSNISTDVSDSVLQIKNNNKCNFVRGSHNGITVYITAPHVTYFIQEGVGTMYSQNTITEKNIDYNIRNAGDIHLTVNAGTVTGHLYGAGDCYLSGNSQNHLVNATGECFINAQDLQTSYCFIIYKSTGQAKVNVGGELDASIQYTGDIYYSGAVSVIHQTITGSGQLLKN